MAQSFFGRLNFQYPNTIFNGCDTLIPGAANSLNLLANSTPGFEDWQKQDLIAGPIVRSNYFQNPVASFILTIQNTANAIINVANSIDPNVTPNLANSGLVNTCNALILTMISFKKHTDNMSGVITTTDPTVPSYDTSMGVGQVNMLNLAKTDTVANVPNTVTILGSFTSLFIGNTLNVNAITLQAFCNAINASVTANTSNIAFNTINQGIATMNYINSLSSGHQSNDWTFHTNAVQAMKDSAFMLQFNTLGATANSLIVSLIGTPRLVANLTNT